MSELVLTTYDWVPEAPRGYVRDLRVRWALEEAGLRYRVESVPPGEPVRAAGRASRLSRPCRACRGRPAFARAHADQMAHFAAAD
jgi:hypothetical protein